MIKESKTRKTFDFGIEPKITTLLAIRDKAFILHMCVPLTRPFSPNQTFISLYTPVVFVLFVIFTSDGVYQLKNK